MASRNSRSGGFFLILAIFAGAGIGIALGEPSIGVIAGTAAGIALALLLWLIDRRGERTPPAG